jgi:hypothetical protein
VTLASLYRGGTADVDKVRALPPLPETADGLGTIAKTLGASETDLLVGKRASEVVLPTDKGHRVRHSWAHVWRAEGFGRAGIGADPAGRGDTR